MKNSEPHELLVCPVCNETLVLMPLEKTCRCINNHNFDVAKQGYINLLTNNQKKSNQPGDSKEMVQARAVFLSKGYYATLSQKINECVLSQLAAKKSEDYHILDIGCGNGYYTNKLMEAAEAKNIPAHYFGLDMSKEAVKFASSSNKLVTWIVANSYYVPLKADSFDCILSVFSPVKIAECTRLMKQSGVFLRVLPGINHLIQIRDIIYETVILNEGNDPAEAYEGMRLIDSSKVSFDVSIVQEDLISLVKMTPHYWKTSKQDKVPLNDLDRLEVTIDMQILVYEKC